jgi:hypothetical protein
MANALEASVRLFGSYGFKKLKKKNSRRRAWGKGGKPLKI